MTALGDVWKQFVKSPLRAAVCPSYRPLLHRQSGKVGQMLRVREAPVGYWEWWFWHRVRRSKGKRWRGSGSSFTWSDPALELVQPREKWEKGVSRQTLIYIYTWNTNSQCSLPEWRETRPADAHWNHEFRTVKSKLSGKKKKEIPSMERMGGWASKRGNIKVHSEGSNYQFLIHGGARINSCPLQFQDKPLKWAVQLRWMFITVRLFHRPQYQTSEHLIPSSPWIWIWLSNDYNLYMIIQRVAVHDQQLITINQDKSTF